MRLSVDWLAEAQVRAVVEALEAQSPGSAFFVGGCVRNALIGARVSDIDIATPLTPQRVVDALTDAGIRAVPTGIEHGTVTAVSGGRGIEITTFRADVETDGRHAVVRFSTEIAEDAKRRDFTMNALYADGTGEVIDPLGGLPDLEARRVRFIGAPEDRIREDHLRILRFFRFSAWYGAGALDGPGLDAAGRLADGIDRLARERIGAEMKKLLVAPDPGGAVHAMEAAGVLARCLPGAAAAALPALVVGEAALSAPPDWVRRLALIGGEDVEARLRLSRAEGRALAELSTLVEEDLPPAEAAERAGADVALSAALIAHARAGTAPPGTLMAEIARGAAAEFPLAAGDLIAAGMLPGPEIGAALARARLAWVASDFALDKDRLVEIGLCKGQQ